MRARIVVATLALAAAAPALAHWGRDIEGNGQKITQKRDVAGFDRVDLRGSIDATVKVGPAHSVAITIDSNLQQHVVTEVRDGRLIVEQDGDLDWEGEARIDITVPTLKALSTGGSGDATIEGSSGGDLDLATSGSADIRWRGGSARRMEVSTSGSGDVFLSGKADTITVSTSGSGDVKGEDFAAHDARVSTSGSGDVTLRLLGGTLQASTSGSGDVMYYGDATVSRSSTSGSGEIRRAR